MENSKLNFKSETGVYHWRGAHHYNDAPDRAMRLPLTSYHAEFQYVGQIDGLRCESNKLLTGMVKEIDREICNQTPSTVFWMNMSNSSRSLKP